MLYTLAQSSPITITAGWGKWGCLKHLSRMEGTDLDRVCFITFCLHIFMFFPASVRTDICFSKNDIKTFLGLYGTHLCYDGRFIPCFTVQLHKHLFPNVPANSIWDQEMYRQMGGGMNDDLPSLYHCGQKQRVMIGSFMGRRGGYCKGQGHPKGRRW